MEKWPCPDCGEELLGAVNRCWKCGRAVVPPQLRPGAKAQASGSTSVLVAEMVETAVAAEPLAPLTAEEVALALAKVPPRRGSPFAYATPARSRSPNAPFYGQGPYRPDGPRPMGALPPLRPKYPQHSGALGGVAASLVLGVASFFILSLTLWGTVAAILALICGLYGLLSDRKRLALAAVLIASLAVTLAMYLIGFAIYDYLYTPTIIAPPPGGF